MGPEKGRSEQGKARRFFRGCRGCLLGPYLDGTIRPEGRKAMDHRWAVERTTRNRRLHAAGRGHPNYFCTTGQEK